jgi:hypothetical protein
MKENIEGREGIAAICLSALVKFEHWAGLFKTGLFHFTWH